MTNNDVIIIGSGVGGSMVARRLSERGVKVLIVERGDFVPREADNWSVSAVFFDRKYKARDTWLDRTGNPFDPGMYYNVGGASKFFGTAMFRLRERDFEELEHKEGLSPAWPIRYPDLAPYYAQAEAIFKVHGDEASDPTSPRNGEPFPFPPIRSEPIVARMANRMRALGLNPSPAPSAVAYGAGAGECILCATCDGFPCQIGQKCDAETSGIEPALATGNVDLKTRVFARRLLLSPDGKVVTGVEVEEAGTVKVLTAALYVVAANAVNSAALLLRSADASAPNGAANSSGVVGRHYMTHNQSALMGLAFERNTTRFQKTLTLNDYYFGDRDFPWPMGVVQMLGKLQGGMLSANVPFLPAFVGREMARHSMDWIALSEDLPDPENRVTLDGGRIRLSVTLNNMLAHRELVKRMQNVMRRSGYPIVLTKSLSSHATAHQCGTVRMGDDPSNAALDPFLRSYDHKNLFVVDASFFPSSAAVNPALTIAAMALRTAEHMLAKDLSVSRSQ
jgi:choline dehydrogenase-like flavoprotein